MIPKYWSYVGVDPYSYRSTRWAQWHGGSKVYFTFNPTSQNTASSLNQSIYIEYNKANMPVATSDSMVFEFEAHYESSIQLSLIGLPTSLRSTWFGTDFKVVYEVEIVLGSYYLHGDASIGYTWVNSVGRATFSVNGSTLTPSGNGSWDVKRDFIIKEVLPLLPENDIVDFKIRIYQPYSNIFDYTFNDPDWDPTTEQTIEATKFKLTYLPLESEPTEELILNTTINDGENLEEITVSHADGTNSGTLNSYRLSNGIITDQWTRRNEGDDTDILTLFLKN